MATPTAKPEAATLEQQVLEIIRELLIEQGKASVAEKLKPNSSFQRDLGLGSLDLVELVIRCESKLDMELPDEIAEQADTPAGWVRAIQQGSQDTHAKSLYRIIPPSGDPPARPAQATDLTQVLRWYASRAPGRIHIHLIEEQGGQGITCGQLLDAAEIVARGLISKGLKRDEAVAILLPTGTDFLHAFFGVMLAGGVPVPVYPPADTSRIGEYVQAQARQLASCHARYLISFDEARPVTRFLGVKTAQLKITTVAALSQLGRRASCKLPVVSETALVQFTSGSTGEPKPVKIPHEALLGNLRSIGERLDVRGEDAVVSWLPLASDMGLVGCWLFSLYHATPLTLIPTQEFLRRPESWLWAIHDSRGTLSAAPNFAYELCINRIPMWTLEGIDLSSWRVAVNGGEPVLPSTVERFRQRFAGCGFRSSAMLPSYGLAEAGVALAIPKPGRLATPDENGLFSAGTPLPGFEVRLAGQRLEFRAAGGGGWIDTGDLAHIRNGEIYVAGRDKESILKQGRALAPQMIEDTVSRVPGVRNSCVSAIGVPDAATGTERLIVVAETEAETAADQQRVERGIKATVADATGSEPDMVWLIPPSTLPKTSNGKLRRRHARELYLNGGIGKTPAAPWLQMAGLWAANAGALLGRGVRRGITVLWRSAVHTLARAAALGGGVLARSSGPGVVPGASRLVLAILGRTPKYEGFPISGPLVLMANRCSRFDPLSLAAVVSGNVLLAGEEALLGVPGSARFLLKPSIARGKKQLDAHLKAGGVVILLPDSPVGVTPARCRYRADAIQSAIECGAQILPVALQELRHKTLLQPGEPVSAQGSAAELREKARRRMAGVYA